VIDPLFWLVLSLLFVTVSLTITLVIAIPTLKEVARAARSAHKLFETLQREFPPTLEAIRLTGLEISDLADDLSEGVQSAGNIVKQVDQSLAGARKQARKVQHGTRSLFTGFKAAWKTFTRPQSTRRSGSPVPTPVDKRLPPASSSPEEPLDSLAELPDSQWTDLQELPHTPNTQPLAPSLVAEETSDPRFLSQDREINR
jgi:uncharacterized protein YoxC